MSLPGCAPEEVSFKVFLADWIGFICSNIVIGALAPIGMLAIVSLGKRMARKAYAVDYFEPFAEGQLGYVALGWAAGAAAELVRAIAAKPLEIWMIWSIFGLGFVFAGAGYVAAVNAVGMAPPLGHAISWLTKEWWLDRYFAFTCSLLVCLVSLIVAIAVHILTA